jgi:hypothetical protein
MFDNTEFQRLFILIIFYFIFTLAFIEFKCNEVKKDIENYIEYYIEQLLKEYDDV